MAALESDSREDRVRKLLAAAACVAASTGRAAPPSAAGPPSAIVFENARVRVWKVSTAPAVFGHPDAVFVAIEDDAKRKAGEAYWSRVPESAGPNVVGTFVIVEPRKSASTPKVHRWKRGDVEFEGRGSSHSARNLGPAVEAVLVTLKP